MAFLNGVRTEQPSRAASNQGMARSVSAATLSSGSSGSVTVALLGGRKERSSGSGEGGGGGGRRTSPSRASSSRASSSNERFPFARYPSGQVKKTPKGSALNGGDYGADYWGGGVRSASADIRRARAPPLRQHLGYGSVVDSADGPVSQQQQQQQQQRASGGDSPTVGGAGEGVEEGGARGVAGTSANNMSALEDCSDSGVDRGTGGVRACGDALKDDPTTAPSFGHAPLLERSLWEQVATWEFASLTVFMSVMILWANSYLGSVRVQLLDAGASTAVATAMVNNFNIVLPLGVLAIPVIGLLLDRAGFGVVLGLCTTSAVGFGLVVLVHDAQAQYVPVCWGGWVGLVCVVYV